MKEKQNERLVRIIVDIDNTTENSYDFNLRAFWLEVNRRLMDNLRQKKNTHTQS